jgi:hypothetical protein
VKYIVFEDVGGKQIPILFPAKIMHVEMREQIPYSKVLSAGYVFHDESGFVCRGGSKELNARSRAEDGQIITDFFRESEDRYRNRP